MADTYNGIAACADDQALRNRVTACAAQQQLAGRFLDPPDPTIWAYQHRWTWAASPGWGAAMESAVADNNPGSDPTIITDGMILSTVQGMTDSAS
jgi:hypothetical protein